MGLKNIWDIKTAPSNEVDELSKALTIPKYIAQALINRKINSFEAAKIYFRPDFNQLHSPFLLLNMEKALAAILAHKKQNHKILLYGDYDVDGTTSVAFLLRIFHHFYPNVLYYIPDRYTEGYGVSSDGVQFAIQHKVKLVITLDCGITAVQQIQELNNHGIHTIVCDHHLPSEILPDAIILDPKQTACTYPYKELSGCGVAFKLAQAMYQNKWINKTLLEEQLDLLCLSIASDMVPITGENRLLAQIGLQQLNQTKNIGLKKLIEKAKVKFPISMDSLAFFIGPRINAAGRMDHAAKIVALFTQVDEMLDMDDIVAQIESDNQERKRIESYTTQEAIAQLNNDENQQFPKCNVVYHPNWTKGVIGIVASKLQQYNYAPSVVLTKNTGNEHYTGSLRSVGSINLPKVLEECSDLLIKYGGHAAAAGMEIKSDNLIPFKERFHQAVVNNSSIEDFSPKINIDALIDLNEIDAKAVRILQLFEPCGIHNPKPIFCANSLKAKNILVIGKDHLKFKIYQENDAHVFDVIYFKGINDYYAIQNKNFQLCFTIGINEWKDQKNIQLQVVDIKFED